MPAITAISTKLARGEQGDFVDEGFRSTTAFYAKSGGERRVTSDEPEGEAAWTRFARLRSAV